jgi:hypothetical protein
VAAHIHQIREEILIISFDLETSSSVDIVYHSKGLHYSSTHLITESMKSEKKAREKAAVYRAAKANDATISPKAAKFTMQISETATVGEIVSFGMCWTHYYVSTKS